MREPDTGQRKFRSTTDQPQPRRVPFGAVSSYLVQITDRLELD